MDFLNYIIDKALVLIPVLNILGAIMKSTTKIKDNYIPLILLFFGIGGAILLMGFSGESVIQGVLITGCAVYGNQIVKQFQKSE